MACLLSCCAPAEEPAEESDSEESDGEQRPLAAGDAKGPPPPTAASPLPRQPSAQGQGGDAFDHMFSGLPWFGEVSQALQGRRCKRVRGEIVQMFDGARDDPDLAWEVHVCANSRERQQAGSFEVLPFAVRCKVPSSKFDKDSSIRKDLDRNRAEGVVMELMIPLDFPMAPPKLRIVCPQVGLTDALKKKMELDGKTPGSTVGKHGGVCAEVLMPGTTAWSPALTLTKVVLLVASQLAVFETGVKSMVPYDGADFERTHGARQDAFGSNGSDFSMFLQKHNNGERFAGKPKS